VFVNENRVVFIFLIRLVDEPSTVITITKERRIIITRKQKQ